MSFRTHRWFRKSKNKNVSIVRIIFIHYTNEDETDSHTTMRRQRVMHRYNCYTFHPEDLEKGQGDSC